MRPDQQQYYVRVELSAEGRAQMRRHQERLAEVCHGLRLTSRLTPPNDLHWTALFLDSPRRWARCLNAVDIAATFTDEDVRTLVTATPSLAPGALSARPTAYDVFFAGPTRAVFVLLVRGTESFTGALLSTVRTTLQTWEHAGRFPRGATDRVLRSSLFPLAREMRGKKPHITLARGRVSRDRQRDVARSMQAAALASRSPITFTAHALRIVGVRPPAAHA